MLPVTESLLWNRHYRNYLVWGGAPRLRRAFFFVEGGEIRVLNHFNSVYVFTQASCRPLLYSSIEAQVLLVASSFLVWNSICCIHFTYSCCMYLPSFSYPDQSNNISWLVEVIKLSTVWFSSNFYSVLGPNAVHYRVLSGAISFSC